MFGNAWNPEQELCIRSLQPWVPCYGKREQGNVLVACLAALAGAAKLLMSSNHASRYVLVCAVSCVSSPQPHEHCRPRLTDQAAKRTCVMILMQQACRIMSYLACR